MLRVVVAICCALFSQLVAASFVAQNNLQGAFFRNAELLSDGQKALNLSVFTDSYADNDTHSYIHPGLAYGLNDRLTLGVVAPYVIVDSNTSGLREVDALAKYRLGGNVDDGVAVTLSAYSGLYSAAASDGVGSGKSGYGLLMNISLYGEVTTLNFSFGGERNDIKIPQPGAGFSAEQQLTLAGGIEYHPEGNWRYLLEGIFTRTNSIDDNFLLMPGIHYSPRDSLDFYAGAVAGVPSSKSMPEWRLSAGISYRFGGDASDATDAVSSRRFPRYAHISRPIPSEPYVDYRYPGFRQAAYRSMDHHVGQGHFMKVSSTGPGNADVSAELSPSDALLLKQIEALRAEVGKLINTPPSTIAHVEIENASGIRGMGDRVAKLLMNQGYSVVSISDRPRTVDKPTQVYYEAGTKNAEIVRVDHARLGVLKQTRIYFIEGFQQRATRVSLSLPGSQRTIPDTNLKNVAEIRVVVGKDMKALLMRRPFQSPST